MTSTFINKYRPYFICDFYLDPQHNNVFKTLIEIDDINILLVGNACSGKTSLINAIIREYYGFSESSIFPEHNIMIINNLKEQGIQFYRNELKTFCQSQSSVHGKKKTIIVDDIDNINEQSQKYFAIVSTNTAKTSSSSRCVPISRKSMKVSNRDSTLSK